MQLMLGDRQAALEEYREAYRLDDANGDYAIRLTKLLLEARSWSEAERTAESALPGAQDVSQKTTLHLYAARAAIGRGQCQAARPHLLAVQRMNPASPLLRPLLEACGFGPGGDL
jgi:tetratricopeptide (TPR) repeat protein